MKKIIWGLGMSIATIAPAVAVVSCGQKHKEVVNNIGVGQPKVEMQGVGQTKLLAAVDKAESFLTVHPEAKLLNISINLLSTLGVDDWHFQKNDQGLWVNSQRGMVRDLFNQIKVNVTNVSDSELTNYYKRLDEQKVQIAATDEEKEAAWGTGTGLSEYIGTEITQPKLDAKDVEWLKTLTDEEITKLIIDAGIYTTPENTADPEAVKTVKNNIGIILGYAPATLDSVDLGAKVPGETFRQELVKMVTKDLRGQLETVKLIASKGTDLSSSNPFTDNDFVAIYDQNFTDVDALKAMTPLIKFKINE